jgi:DnaJ homolog subfamily C member 13
LQHLLIKSQLLVCRRYESQMSNYKYPAYRTLLDCLRVPASCVEALNYTGENSISDTCLAKSERVAFVLSAIDLIYHTCLISPQNSEELVVESGVDTLALLLRFYVRLYSRQASKDSPSEARLAADSLSISTLVCRTLSGVAFFETGRKAIRDVSDLALFILAWKSCFDGALVRRGSQDVNAEAIVRYALEGLINMSRDVELRHMLLGCGVVWPLLRLLLQFDTSAESNEAVSPCNVHAHLAVDGLALLSGMRVTSPINDTLSACLSNLLTAPIAQLLRIARTGEILRALNSNVETASVIWNVSMRRQLESFLVEIEKNRPANLVVAAQQELEPAQSFVHESLRDEFLLDGVYVRVFIKNGKDALATVRDPVRLLRSVLAFLARCINNSDVIDWDELRVEESDSVGSLPSYDVKSPNFLLAMSALRVLTGNDGILDDLYSDESCILPHVLFGLLSVEGESPEVRGIGLFENAAS